MIPLPHRQTGCVALRGNGLEIGALHEPMRLPAGCTVRYFDVVDAPTALKLFPEIDSAALVPVDFVGNIDDDGLQQFADGQFDFAICSHVLEHLANPIKAMRDLFRIVRPGGHVVLAIPDKDYTFDRSRKLTSFDHLWDDFTNDVRENTDDHYLDFLRAAGAHVFDEPPENLPGHLGWVRRRREHAHVWDSASFRAFLDTGFSRLKINAALHFESRSAENQIEYFSIWEKLPG